MASRPARATAVTLLSAPTVLIAHLATTGVAPGTSAMLLVGAIVFAVSLLAPARGAVSLALTVGLAQVVAHTALALRVFGAGSTPGRPDAVTGCLPAVGRGAELGVRLAVLHSGGQCPPGMPGPAEALTAFVSAALTAVAILVGHGLVAALTSLLVATGDATLRLVRTLLTFVATVLVVLLGELPAPARLRATPESVRTIRGRRRMPPALLRGPPATTRGISFVLP